MSDGGGTITCSWASRSKLTVWTETGASAIAQ